MMQKQRARAALPAVRLLSDTVGDIRGYIAIWGSHEERDAYNTWFDKAAPPEMGLDYLPIPLYYEHGQDAKVRQLPIGKVTEFGFDNIGIRFEGRLDRSHPDFARFCDELKRGLLATSSGSAEHLVEFDGMGRFVRWMLSELSLTKNPAESRMPVVQLVRNAPWTRDALERESTSEIDLTRTPTMFVFKNASGKPVSRQQALADLRAQRALFDADGNELSPEQCIAQLLQDGVPLDGLMQIIQQYAPTTEDQMMGGTEELSAPAPGSQPATPATSPNALPADMVSPTLPTGGLTDEEILQQVALMLQGRSRPQPQAPKRSGYNSDAERREVERLRAENEALRRGQAPANYAPPAAHAPAALPPANRSNGGGTTPRVRVMDKFQHLTAAEMALGYSMMRNSRLRDGGSIPVSEEYVKAMALKTAIAQERGDKAATDPSVRANFQLRANEVMQTSLADYGDEYVYDMIGTDLWEKIRFGTPTYDMMKSMGMDSKELPAGFAGETIQLESDDGTWYVTGEASAYDPTSGMITPKGSPTKTKTANLTVPIAKLSYKQYLTQELIEDAIIDMVAEVKRKIEIGGKEQLEYILLNGDTATADNTNINAIDGSVAASPSKPSYTMVDGLLKLPLVTYTAGSLDASNTIDEVLFLNLLKKLPKQHRQDRTKLLYIVESDTGIAASNIASVKTRDVYSAATLEEGVLTSIWRIKVLESGQIALANTAGKVATGTPANNTRGRILLVRPDQWADRWKRRPKTDIFYDGASDTTRFTCHLRWGLKARDNDASKVAYNVSVTIS